MLVVMSIDRNKQDVSVYDNLQLADTFIYNLKIIFICVMKEQCGDQGEST